MKTDILLILNQHLNEVDANLIDNKDTLYLLNKVNPTIDYPMINRKITDLKQQKVETEKCIDWLNSINIE